ncbi:MAG: hypothetical protein ACLFRX_09000 [Gemmatimonadota bacterium]
MQKWMSVAAVAILMGLGCQIAEREVAHGNDICEPVSLETALPAALVETSGVAASHSHPGVFWTHNDSGGDPLVFAVDSAGRLLATVRLRGATNRDWEDIAVGPCDPGGPSCLWIAETGDNDEKYPHAAVYRIPEPAPDDAAVDADIFRFQYPGGARDAEAMFVTDAGVYVISKGRSHAIELFRLPPPYQADATVPLARLQRLAPPPTSVSAQVTAAANDGTHAVLRTYSGLHFFTIEADTLRPYGTPADGVAPSQPQGEGVDFLDGGRFVLTSEARGARPPTLAITRCDPTRTPADTAATP